MAEQGLADTKVIDLAHGIAGPYCAKLPTDLGPTVTKTEKPGERDPAREKGPFFENLPHPEKSGPFSTSIPIKRTLPESRKPIRERFFLRSY